MEKKGFLKGIISILLVRCMKFNFIGKILVLSLIFSGFTACVSLKAINGSSPPIDYSAIGADQSVVIAYVEDLIREPSFWDYFFGGSGKLLGDFMEQSRRIELIFVGSDNGIEPTALVNYDQRTLDKLKKKQGANVLPNSCQIPVPNGSYQLKIQIVMGDTTVDTVPINLDLDNMAATYKIRKARPDEKNAAQVGQGNESYILELVALKPLR
jgi:hypothetical protein